jgi:hypothetical protein
MTSGSVNERRVATILTRAGYQWTRAGGRILKLPGGRFIAQRQDFFSCLDFMAFRPHERHLLGIQVTTKNQAPNRRRKVEAALPKYGHPIRQALRVELWVWGYWSDGRGWGFRREEYMGRRDWCVTTHEPSPGRAAGSKPGSASGGKVRA